MRITGSSPLSLTQALDLKPYKRGDMLELSAGPGAMALAMKIGPHDVTDPARLGTLAYTSVDAFANDPRSPLALTAIAGFMGYYNQKGPADFQIPKRDIAGLAIITASLGFYQAITHRKDALHIAVAGASLVASVITAVNNSPGANYAGLFVLGAKTGLGLYDLYKV